MWLRPIKVKNPYLHSKCRILAWFLVGPQVALNIPKQQKKKKERNLNNQDKEYFDMIFFNKNWAIYFLISIFFFNFALKYSLSQLSGLCLRRWQLHSPHPGFSPKGNQASGANWILVCSGQKGRGREKWTSPPVLRMSQAQKLCPSSQRKL